MGTHNSQSSRSYISSSCELQFRKTEDLRAWIDVCCFEQNLKLAGIVFDKHNLQGSHKS